MGERTDDLATDSEDSDSDSDSDSEEDENIAARRIRTKKAKACVWFALLLSQLLSFWLLLVIFGIFPLPCQEDFDLDQRIATLMNWERQFERNGTMSLFPKH